MNFWQFTPYAIFYFTAAAIAFSLSFFVWQMRDVSGKTYFRFLTLFSGIWTLGYTFEVFSADIGFKLFMLRIEYFGIICTVIFWLFFVVSYTNSDNWLSKWMKELIVIIPILTFIQVLTIQSHDFFYQNITYIEVNDLLVIEKDYGPGFYIWALYSYFILVVGSVILIRGIINMPIKYRRQVFPIITSLFVIAVPNILYILGINIIPPYDPTCLSFVIVGLIFFMIIHFDKFLNIVPVAHNLVFKNTKSGIIIINERGTILDVNPSAERIFSVEEKGMAGNNVLDYLVDFSDVYEHLLVDQDYRAEIKFEKNDTYFELITASLIDYKKRILGKILVFYDITERNQALYDLDAYARTVAHDLKTPMNSVLGFIQLLKEINLQDNNQKIYSQYIYDGVSKMKDIIEGLLLLARVRNKDDIDTTPIETGKIIKIVLYRLESLIKQTKGIIKKADNWPTATGYPIWVEEIWVNYISNALKYGGDPPIVEIGATELEDSIQFWVKDNGKGLKKHETNNLFKEFSQLESRKNNTQGHGLGLSIVKRITTKLGGTVGVESKIGKGSTFYFTLPKE